MKRVLDLKTISKGTIDIWDGTNVDDLRKIALEFAGTKLDKVLDFLLLRLILQSLVHFKPMKLDAINELIENRDAGKNLVIFIEKRTSFTMKTAQMDIAGYSNIIVRRVDLEVGSTLAEKYKFELENSFMVFNDEKPKVVKFPGFSARAYIRDYLRSLPNTEPPVYERKAKNLKLKI